MTNDTLALRPVDTPIGTLHVIAGDAGVVRILFAEQHADEIAAEIGDRLGQDVQRASGADAVADQLEQFFAGDRTDFDVPLDLRLAGSGFHRDALEAIASIPYGQRASYGEVAEMTGHPRAARAVGTACARNPVPLIIPCHRVVRASGDLGEYGGRPEVKRWLLDFEAARS